MPDLPDYYQYVTPVTVEIPAGEEPEYIFRPKGGVLAKGSVTTTSSYQTVASHTPAAGLTFQLAKIVISAEKAAWVKYRWAGSDISAERLLDDKTILIEHFPWDYKEMIGDGSKAFDVQAKYDSEAGKVNVEIVGENV